MTRYDVPPTSIYLDHLANILESLALTGSCDLRTLALVAHAVGLRGLFRFVGAGIVDGKIQAHDPIDY